MRQNTKASYGSVARSLHWLTALIILSNIALGLWAERIPLEQMALKVQVFSFHKTLGLAALVVALARIGWALTQTRPAPVHPERRLETLLALIEGWVQTVVSAALGDRIPGASALSETLRRRRATGGPAEQTFATLVGLELRPRKMREAADLWQRLTEAVGSDARDGVWQHPDLLPDSSDLDEPAAFIDRMVGGDTSGMDSAIEEAISDLERDIQRGSTDGPDGDSDGPDRPRDN